MKLILIFLFSAIAALAQTPEWSRKYHTGSVTCLNFSGDGGKLLSGSLDSTVKLWDVFKSDTLKNYSQPRAVHSVQMNSTGEWFIASLAQKSQASYDKPSDAINFKIDLNTRVVLDSFVSPSIVYKSDVGFNWAYLIAASSNKTVLFKNDKTAITVLTGGFQSVSAGSGGSGQSAMIEILNLDSLKNASARISTVAGSPTTFDLSNNNRYLVYGGNHYSEFHAAQSSGGWSTKNDIWKCELYDFENKKTVKIPGLNEFIQDPNQQSGVYISKATPHNMVLKTTFTADSKKLLTANRAGSIHVRSVPEGVIIDSLGSQTSLAIALAADMRGRYYFSAHEDTTLRIWTPGVHNIFNRIPLQSLVTTIAVSPDSVHFATAHSDGTVSYWNIDSLVLKAEADSIFIPSAISLSDNFYICAGDSITLRISAQSNFGEELTYQWLFNNIPLEDNPEIHGSKTQNLFTSKIKGGNYSVKISSEMGGNLIIPIYPHIARLPVITKITPKDMGSVQYWLEVSVVVEDTVNTTYQWYKNGEIIPAGTKAILYNGIPYSKQLDGIYTVLITNLCGSVISQEIILGNASSVENPFKSTTTLTSVPNPFKNSTAIRFSLPSSLKIKLAVTDILGREVVVLKDGFTEMGEQQVVFKNEDLPDGTYFVTLSGDGLLKTIPVQITR